MPDDGGRGGTDPLRLRHESRCHRLLRLSHAGLYPARWTLPIPPANIQNISNVDVYFTLLYGVTLEYHYEANTVSTG